MACYSQPMRLLQIVIAVAVIGSNIQWKWTDNQYLAAGLGILAAWGAAHAIYWITGRLRTRQRRERTGSY